MLTIGAGGGTLDFGAGNTGAVFNFTGFSDPTNALLQVTDWRGNFSDGNGNGGDGLDQLLIGTSNSLSSQQVSDIVFVNPYDAQDGIQYSGSFTANQLLDGEISPAPEPGEVATLSMIMLGLGGLIFKARKRRAAELTQTK